MTAGWRRFVIGGCDEGAAAVSSPSPQDYGPMNRARTGRKRRSLRRGKTCPVSGSRPSRLKGGWKVPLNGRQHGPSPWARASVGVRFFYLPQAGKTLYVRLALIPERERTVRNREELAEVIRLARQCVVLFVRLFFSRGHWEAFKWSMTHKEERRC